MIRLVLLAVIVNGAGVPVPVNGTLTLAFAGAFETMVSCPVRAPTMVGVNLTLTVQVAAGARVAPQVLAEMAKSGGTPVASVLVIPIELMAYGPAPGAPSFLMVTVCDPLVER